MMDHSASLWNEIVWARGRWSAGELSRRPLCAPATARETRPRLAPVAIPSIRHCVQVTESLSLTSQALSCLPPPATSSRPLGPSGTKKKDFPDPDSYFPTRVQRAWAFVPSASSLALSQRPTPLRTLLQLATLRCFFLRCRSFSPPRPSRWPPRRSPRPRTTQTVPPVRVPPCPVLYRAHLCSL